MYVLHPTPRHSVEVRMVALQERAVVRHLHEFSRAILEPKLPKAPGDAGGPRQKPGRQVLRLHISQLLFQPVVRVLWNLKTALLEGVKHAAGAKAQAQGIRLMYERVCREQTALFTVTHVCQ